MCRPKWHGKSILKYKRDNKMFILVAAFIWQKALLIHYLDKPCFGHLKKILGKSWKWGLYSYVCDSYLSTKHVACIQAFFTINVSWFSHISESQMPGSPSSRQGLDCVHVRTLSFANTCCEPWCQACSCQYRNESKKVLKRRIIKVVLVLFWKS